MNLNNNAKRRHWTREQRRDAHRLGLAGTPEVADTPEVAFEIRGSSEFAGKGVEVAGDVCRYREHTVIQDAFGKYREQVLPGAASHLLGSPNLRTVFLINHNRDDIPLARVPTTMSFTDTPTALRFRAVLDTRMHSAHDLVCAMEDGIMRSTSWAFTVDKGGDVWHGADKDSRDLVRFGAIHDVSAVSEPAYKSASIGFADDERKKKKGRRCRDCGGTGYLGSAVCPACAGSGIDGTQNIPASPGGSMQSDGSGTRAAIELQLDLHRLRTLPPKVRRVLGVIASNMLDTCRRCETPPPNVSGI